MDDSVIMLNLSVFLLQAYNDHMWIFALFVVSLFSFPFFKKVELA